MPANTQTSSAVTYVRTTPSTVTATVLGDVGLGRSGADGDNADDLIVRDDKERDFLVAAVDLLETYGEPQEGDRISFAIQHDDGDPHAATGSATQKSLTYIVTRQATGDPCWRWTDSTQSTYRIHAKLTLDDTETITW